MSVTAPQAASSPLATMLLAAARRLWSSALPFIVVIALWQFASLFFPRFLFPSLIDVFWRCLEIFVDGAMFNSGQSCCGIERIYVHASLFDAFVEGAASLARTYVLGDPRDPATTLGPLVSPAAASFVRGQIDEAIARGARGHVDESAFPASARGTAYLAPQILTGVHHQMRLMTEESFGPVVGVMPVADDEEAVRMMNDSAFGLTACVYTRSLDAAERLGASLETGTVFMNRCDYLDPELAWTGVKLSGRGCTLSRYGFHQLTRPKSYHLKLA